MAEYIDRDAFIAQKRELYCKDCDRRKGMKNGKYRILYDIGDVPCRACGIEDVLSDVEDFPAADVQPVVRCKDCKHFHLDYFGEVNGVNIIVAHEICDLWAGGCRTTQNAFCSNGVRADGEA